MPQANSYLNQIASVMQSQAQRREAAYQALQVDNPGAAKERLNALVGQTLSPETVEQIGGYFDRLHRNSEVLLEHDVDLMNNVAQYAHDSARAEPLPGSKDCPKYQEKLRQYYEQKGYQEALATFQQEMQKFKQEYESQQAQGFAQQAVKLIRGTKKVGEQGRDDQGRFTNKLEVSYEEWGWAQKEAEKRWQQEYLNCNPMIKSAMKTIQQYESKHGGESELMRDLKALVPGAERLMADMASDLKWLAQGLGRAGSGLVNGVLSIDKAMDKVASRAWSQVVSIHDGLESLLVKGWRTLMG